MDAIGRAKSTRAIATTLVAGIALILVVGLVFSVAYSSRQITTDAGSLHIADETLRSATVARAQLALAVHASAVDREFGTDSRNIIDTALVETQQALSDAVGGLNLGAGDTPDFDGSVPLLRRFVAIAEQIATHLMNGDSVEAQALSGELDTSFRALLGELSLTRDEIARRVSSSDALLGRIGDLARFLVAFLVPAAVIFIYRELSRRQQRQSELEARLANERELAAAREQFIANASHELRTPLTGIKGLAMLLEEDPHIESSATAAELVDLIVSEAEDLSRMVEDLLTAARLDAGALTYTFEDVDPAVEAAEVIEPLTRNGVVVGSDCEPGLVRADRLRLRQIIRNLVSNARKYGGPDVRVEGRIVDRTYVCSVIDNGSGIPEEIADRVFERFIHQGQATATQDSVGLGLSIVRALADGMGGVVRYERVRGETHFSLRIPLLEAVGAAPTGSAQNSTLTAAEG